ncbi:hypothetical protein [Enhygromyxa salina]|uniref:Leucine Rich repeats (2 copies) n=1 Tax=Enhygromyxa salina TaxID=215803 RepID=A0A2S9YXJ2_9BACT|nr:hypothetical protein [Enhygromyxa salina]PRQ09782.1 hypothetical protein ENSA7_05370 [Enhygromyxa salina]
MITQPDMLFREHVVRGLPTSLASSDDIRDGAPIPASTYVQLHDPLDEARVAELAKYPQITRLSLAGGASVPLGGLAVLPSLRSLHVLHDFGSPPSYAGLELIPELEVLSIARAGGGLALTREAVEVVARSPKLAVLWLSASELPGLADQLPALAAAPALISLGLVQARGQLAPAALAPLTGRLRTLDLTNNGGWITDAHLEALAGCSIERLVLRKHVHAKPPLTDAGVAALAGWPALRHVDVRDCDGVKAKGFEALASMPLQGVDLGSTGGSARALNAKAVKGLAKLTALRHLGLYGATAVPDATLAALGDLGELESWSFIADRTKLSPEAVTAFVQGRSGLRRLVLSGATSPQTIEAIQAPKNLLELRLADASALDSSSYARIAEAAAPEAIELWQCRASEGDLDVLAASPAGAVASLFCAPPASSELRAKYPTLRLR